MRTAIVYNFLLEATLMSSIAILLMIPIRHFLRGRLSSGALCFGWGLVAIRLLCPLALPNPFIADIRPAFQTDMAIRPIAGQLKVRAADAVMGLWGASANAFGVESSVSRTLNQLVADSYNGMLSINLMHMYVLGLLLVTVWFAISNVRFRRQLKRNRIEPISGELLEGYHALCQTMGVKPLPCFYVDPLPSACLVGVLHPSIALPLTMKPEETLQALQHELCHYRGKHHWRGVVRLLCCALHWFNPLVWAAAQMSRTDTELACDERVILHMQPEEKRAYANTLVQAAAQRATPGIGVLSTCMSMTGRTLKTRVNQILRSENMKKGFAICFVLLASMALVGAFATSEVAHRLEMPAFAQGDIRLEHREISGELMQVNEDVKKQAIAYAEEIWQNPYVQEDTEGLTWQVQGVGERLEVTGHGANGDIELATMFMTDGRIVYLANLRQGPTESFAVDDPIYENQPEQMKLLRDFGIAGLESINPGSLEGMGHVTGGSEGMYQSNRSLWFGENSDTANAIYRRTFRVLAEPEIKLTYFADFAYIDSYDTDRIEPGNG